MGEFDDVVARHELYHKMEMARLKDKKKEQKLWNISTDKEMNKIVKCLHKPDQPKKEKGKMKEKYLMLKDRKRQVRVILCLVQTIEPKTDPFEGFDGTQSLASFDTVGPFNFETIDVLYYGMAIRSEMDDNDYVTGQRLAKSRAIREMRGRKPCFVCRPEAIKNLWSLCWEDFQKLMYITAGLTSDFQKGDQWYDEGTIKAFMRGMGKHVSNAKA